MQTLEEQNHFSQLYPPKMRAKKPKRGMSDASPYVQLPTKTTDVKAGDAYLHLRYAKKRKNKS